MIRTASACVVLPELTKTVFPSTRGRSRYTQAAQVMPVSLRGDADRMPEVADWTNNDLKAYATEVKAVDSATATVSTSLKAATATPSERTLSTVRTAVQTLGTSLRALENAVRSTC